MKRHSLPNSAERLQGEIRVAVNDDVDDVVVHLHRRSCSMSDILNDGSEISNISDASAITDIVDAGPDADVLDLKFYGNTSKRTSIDTFSNTSRNGQIVDDYGWLRSDSFISELQRGDIDQDIITEELKKLEDKKPKTCRRRMVRRLKSTPVVSVLLFLIVLDAALVLAELVLDIQGSLADFQNLKHETDSIMDFVMKSQSDHLGNYTENNVDEIMKILKNAYNYTDNHPTGHKRKLLAAGGGGNSDDKYVYHSGHSHLHEIAHGIHMASIVILGILLCEVILKIIGLGCDFLKYKIEVIDAIIVTGSFILDIVFLYESTKTLSVMIILILWRIVRLLNAFIVQEKQRLKFLLRVTKTSNRLAKQRIIFLNDSLKAKHKEIQTLRNLCSILGGSEPATKQGKKPPVVKKKRPNSGLSPLLMSALSTTTLGLLPSVNNNNNGGAFSSPFGKKTNKSKPRIHSLSTSAIDCGDLIEDDRLAEKRHDKARSKTILDPGLSVSVDNLSNPPPDYNSIIERLSPSPKVNGSICKGTYTDTIIPIDSNDNLNRDETSSNTSTPSHVGVPRTDTKSRLLNIGDEGDIGYDNEAFAAQSPEESGTNKNTTSNKRSFMAWLLPKKKDKYIIPEVRVSKPHQSSSANIQDSDGDIPASNATDEDTLDNNTVSENQAAETYATDKADSDSGSAISFNMFSYRPNETLLDDDSEKSLYTNIINSPELRMNDASNYATNSQPADVNPVTKSDAFPLLTDAQKKVLPIKAPSYPIAVQPAQSLDGSSTNIALQGNPRTSLDEDVLEHAPIPLAPSVVEKQFVSTENSDSDTEVYNTSL